MRNTILISLLLMLLPVSVSAHFYTITRDSESRPTVIQKEVYNHTRKNITKEKRNKIMSKETLAVRLDNQNTFEEDSQYNDRKVSLKTEQQKKADDITKAENNLPEFTIPNLYKGIIRSRILFPKIIGLTILFGSSVCRNKHNFSDLPIHVQGNTMNSVIGRNVYGLIIQKYNISAKEETICFDLRLGMWKILII